MAGSPGRWLLTASLISVLSAAAPVLAQSGRPWVDPPSENDTTPSSSPTPAPAVSAPATPAPQAAAPAPSAPQPSSASASAEAAKEKEAVASRSPAEVSPRKEVAGEQVEQKTVTERKVRRSTQQARSVTRPQKREERTARRRGEPGLAVSQARAPRNGIERRARVTRYGSAQEGIDAGLEVMRLRTIQLPDGRRIEVLTRPSQDIAGELPDGY